LFIYIRWNLPLTGDKKTDDDILAFANARQRILSQVQKCKQIKKNSYLKNLYIFYYRKLILFIFFCFNDNSPVSSRFLENERKNDCSRFVEKVK
jgi:hypothetical protein